MSTARADERRVGRRDRSRDLVVVHQNECGRGGVCGAGLVVGYSDCLWVGFGSRHGLRRLRRDLFHLCTVNHIKVCASRVVFIFASGLVAVHVGLRAKLPDPVGRQGTGCDVLRDEEIILAPRFHSGSGLTGDVVG